LVSGHRHDDPDGPGAGLVTLRNDANKAFLADVIDSWAKDGPKALAACAKQTPAAYVKIMALLVPKEMKVEHQGRLGQLTDEQLDEAIAMVEEMIARKAGDRAMLIEGEAEVVPGLPAPERPKKAP
jgi:Ni,Fe-hydrogenase maturation factor